MRLVWLPCLVALGCGHSSGEHPPDPDATAGTDGAQPGDDDAAVTDGPAGDAAVMPDGPVGPADPLAHPSLACHETHGDYFEDVLVAADGSITAVGYTRVYFGTPNPTKDALIVRISPAGQIVWQKRLGGATADDFFAKVVALPNGGVMAVGNTNSHGGSQEAWIVRFDAAGAVTAETIYPGAGFDEVTNVLPTADGGHLLTGNTSSYGAAGYDAWLLKLSSTGAVEWQNRYGDQTSSQDRFFAAAEVTGGFIAIGRTASFGTTYDDMWAVRVDTTGAIVWQYRYDVSIDDVISAAVPTTQGLLLAGETQDKGWVSKLALDGTLVWSKLIDNTQADGDVLFAAQPDGNQGVAVAGYTFYTHDFNDPPSHDYDFWLMDVDASGTVGWSKALGGEGPEWARGLARHPAGGYVAVGWSASFGGQALEPASWVLALSGAGSISAGCDTAQGHAATFVATDGTATRRTTTGVATATTAAATAVSSTVTAAALTCSPTTCAQ